MKIVIENYTIDVNEESIISSKRSSWINARVRAFAWTGIEKPILAEKFAEVYDLVKGN